MNDFIHTVTYSLISMLTRLLHRLKKETRRALRILRSWKRERRMMRRSIPPRHHRDSLRLPVRPYQQWTGYSCSASVAQMAYEYVSGERMGHRQAIKITRCKPDGATLESVAKVLKRKTGCVTRELPRRHAALRSALSKGSVILAGDTKEHESDHAILLVGFTPRGVLVG